MATVVLLGTLDTKGQEYEYLRDRLREQGVDVAASSTRASSSRRSTPTSRRTRWPRPPAPTSRRSRDAGDRGAAVEAMCRGAAVGRRRGCTPRAGSTGSSPSAGRATRRSAPRRCAALPVGVPKLIVSTVASGDTRPYVGAKDVSMIYSVVDISGLNRISERILANAAGAIAGMAQVTRSPESGERAAAGRRDDVRRHDARGRRGRASGSRSSATRCSSSTPPARAASRWRRSRAAGFLAGVLDLTTTELADELVGGVLSAGPDRLEAAGELGLPQVVSLGALDMVNFGPRETVPPQFEDRQPLRPQPDGHADADDARGVRRARPPDRAEALRGDRARPRSSSR